MTAPRYAHLAARLLAAAQPTPKAPTPDARSRAIAALERALQERARRRTRSRLVMWAAAAAAVVAIGSGTVHLMNTARLMSSSSHGASQTAASQTAAQGETGIVGHPIGAGATIWQGSQSAAGLEQALTDGYAIKPGSHVSAGPNGRLVLAFATGTRLLVEEGAGLTVVDQGAHDVLSLDKGSLHADVAKVEKGHSFVVRTQDSEIHVVGTSFQVGVVPADASCGNGTTTRVRVDEGVVVVRHGASEDRVPAGSSWPLGCPIAPPAPAEPDRTTAAAAPVHAPAMPVATIHVASEHGGHASPSSTLAEQNDMFAEALAAKRSGGAAAGVAGFDRFLAKYPGSPLAESATAERMKLLRATDRPRAVAAARDYLARYPGGFAHADAESIVSEGR